ncbi:MAG: Rieske (2Fe-2S) protein [Comamonadaceae bacterium]|nr:MAG: Rieske (2Fe-2S) protein [Comamonadaceae bacterium]
MTDPAILCKSADLGDGGLAFKFTAPDGSPAFAVRWQGVARGYVNSCPHAGGPLDFEGEVLERSGRFLMCARHGAIFAPDSGECMGGPCRGARLVPVVLHEDSEGMVRLGPA